MRLLCLLASALLLGAAEPTRPNFVFVLIDDMGWGDFSCFGNTEAKTPNIDRLAAEGCREGLRRLRETSLTENRPRGARYPLPFSRRARPSPSRALRRPEPLRR